MMKILKIFFASLILIFFVSLTYLSIFGIETNRFNKLISDKIRNIHPEIDVKLKKIKLTIELFELKVLIVTKNPVIEIANNLNFDVNEQNISKDDLLDADELFFTGTATEVIGVVSVDNTNIGNGSPGEVTNSIRTKYLEIVNGNDDNSDNYLTLVK